MCGRGLSSYSSWGGENFIHGMIEMRNDLILELFWCLPHGAMLCRGFLFFVEFGFMILHDVPRGLHCGGSLVVDMLM